MLRGFALAALHFILVLLFPGQLFSAFLPTIAVSCQVLPPLGSKWQNSGVPDETAGVLAFRYYGLKFYDVLGLSSFGTLDHLELHRLVFGQGTEPVAYDSAVMHKHIRTVFPADEAKALGVIKPFYRTSFLHCETSSRYCQNIPAKKAGRTAVRQKKIGRGY
jgi:hypothetical protein